MKPTALLAFAAVFMGMTGAQATEVTSEVLVTMCKAPEKTTIRTYCYGFLDGVFGLAAGLDLLRIRSTAEGRVVVELKDQPGLPRVCVPTLNAEDTRLLYLRYIESHPNRLSLPAHVTVAETLAAVSSCTNSAPR